MVMTHMITSIENTQIFQAIISIISIYVMNMLVKT